MAEMELMTTTMPNSKPKMKDLDRMETKIPISRRTLEMIQEMVRELGTSSNVRRLMRDSGMPDTPENRVIAAIEEAIIWRYAKLFLKNKINDTLPKFLRRRNDLDPADVFTRLFGYPPDSEIGRASYRERV